MLQARTLPRSAYHIIEISSGRFGARQQQIAERM